jgi:hypothetical protein
MKDLDFDELDKAVNSLVSQDRPKTIAKSVPSSIPVSANTSSVSINTTPIEAQPTPVPGPRAVNVSRSISPAPRSRLGVRPGNTKVVDIMAPKPNPRSPRVGATIKPSNSVKPASEPVAAPAPRPRAVPTPTQTTPDKDPSTTEALAVIRDEIPAQTEAVTSTPEDTLIKVPTAEQWPDPLDFTDQEKSKSQSEATSLKEPVSPFLPDTKVEKRPLGGFNPKVEAPVEEPETEPQMTENPVVQSSVPEELKPAVLAVEADEEADQLVATDLTSAAPETIETATLAEPVAELKEPAQPKFEQQVRDNARAAITQQYQTPEKHLDDKPRPVFDTKEYHPPLLEATAHGHRSGIWGKLFIALLILLVLAVGGYFVFMYFVQGV